MSLYKYVIEGKLYVKDIDFISQISILTDEFDLFAETEKTENGFLIKIEATQELLVDFEPKLFKKITTLMEIRLYTKKELKSPKRGIMSEIKNNKEFKQCAQYLRQEKIIAVKGENSYHLVCNASKLKAVQVLRSVISQPEKPLSVMYKNIQKAQKLILLSPKEEALLLSTKRPIVVAKLRNLHRLEKVKYKHKLTPLINTINQRINLSLAHNDLYKKLFEDIDFPIVSIDAKTKDDTIISDKNILMKTYGNHIEHILESNIDISNPKPREVLQITYGKTQSFEPKIKAKDEAFEVCLDYEKSIISKFKFKPLKLLKNDEPKYKALSLLFAKLPIEQILELKLSFTTAEIKKEYQNWQDNINTYESNSLISLFDAIASLSGDLQQKSFIDHSIMLTEKHYEVCEEDLFDFEIKDNEVEIDIITRYLKNSKLKHLGSTLVNTISTIITQIAKEQDLDVHLSGELFHYRDLIELTIEKLEDEDIKVT